MTQTDLFLKMEQLEKKVYSQDQKIALVFKYLKKFNDTQDNPRRKIGYKRNEEK